MKKQITYMLFTGVCLLVAMQATAQQFNATYCVEDYTLSIRDDASGYSYLAWDRVESTNGASPWHPLYARYVGNNTVPSYCHQDCERYTGTETYWVGVMVIRSDGQIRYGVSGSLLPDKNLRLNPGFIQVSAF